MLRFLLPQVLLLEGVTANLVKYQTLPKAEWFNLLSSVWTRSDCCNNRHSLTAHKQSCKCSCESLCNRSSFIRIGCYTDNSNRKSLYGYSSNVLWHGKMTLEKAKLRAHSIAFKNICLFHLRRYLVLSFSGSKYCHVRCMFFFSRYIFTFCWCK